VAKGKTSSESRPAEPASVRPRAPEDRPYYYIFVRDLVVPCVIGIHPHERHLAQRVRVNVDLTVEDPCGSAGDDIANVVSYDDVVAGIRSLARRGGIGLVETFAEKIAALCLRDARVAAARIRVEKLDVFAEAESVGVEIERRRERATPGAVD
jgi:dihydroneopterin aldolase